MTKLTDDQKRLLDMLEERGIGKDMTDAEKLVMLQGLEKKETKGMYLALSHDKAGNEVLVTKAPTLDFDHIPQDTAAAAATSIAINGLGSAPYGGKILGMSRPTWLGGTSATRVAAETSVTRIGGMSTRLLSGTGVATGIVESWQDIKTGYNAIGNDGRQVAKSSINVSGAVAGGVAGAYVGAAGAGVLSAALAGGAAGSVVPGIGTIIGFVVVGACAAGAAYLGHKAGENASNAMLGETVTEKANKLAYAAAMGKLDAPRAVAVDSALSQVIIDQRQQAAKLQAAQAGLGDTGTIASTTQSIIPPGVLAAKSRAPSV